MIEASSAGFGRRFAALLYDALLLAGILLLLSTAAVFAHHGAILPSDGALALAYHSTELAVIILYYVVNWTRSGATLGMHAWRLRAVMDDGAPMGWPFALLRLPLATLSWLPLGLGVLWLYVDAEHAAAQDRLSRTRVVRLP